MKQENIFSWRQSADVKSWILK